MSGYVGNLNAKQEEALLQFRNKMSDILPPEELEDDYFLLRWLRARDFDVSKSEQMLRKNCRFRKEWKIRKLVEEDNFPEVWRNYYPGDYIGYDKEGSPLFFVNMGKFDVKGIFLSLKSDDLTKYCLAVAEKGMQLCENQSEKLGRKIENVTIVEDMADMSMTGHYKPAITLFTKILGLFDENYPEYMKHVFVVNAPRIFHFFFAIIKPFLSKKTREKMRFLGSNYPQVLAEYIDKDVIPKALGGNLVDKDGDPHCSGLIGCGGQVPTSYYRSELIKDSERPLDDYSLVVIARGDSMKLNYDIEKPGTLIQWEFKTEYHNIGFGVIKVIESKDGSEENYEVIPVMRRSSHIVLEEGSYFCDEPGKYILHFDNSFSWITSKQLRYVIEIIPPEKAMPSDHFEENDDTTKNPSDSEITCDGKNE